MAIDTACSSAHHAIHEACQAIRLGDVDQALVGGANLSLDPDKLSTLASFQ
jgi:emericellamide synthase (highly reducing iterative type I polyketide synthase)